MANFKLVPMVFNFKQSKEKDKKQSIMLSKSRTESFDELKAQMQCVISTSKQSVADLWEVKFEEKSGKLRITQIKDIKKNKVKYNIKKDS